MPDVVGLERASDVVGLEGAAPVVALEGAADVIGVDPMGAVETDDDDVELGG